MDAAATAVSFTLSNASLWMPKLVEVLTLLLYIAHTLLEAVLGAVKLRAASLSLHRWAVAQESAKRPSGVKTFAV